MSLFKFADVQHTEQPKHNPIVEEIKINFDAHMMNDFERMKFLLGAMDKDDSTYFMTDGAWSNIDLVERILQITGPAEVDFCSWSIGSDTLRKFADWQSTGAITQIHVVLDQGLRNRKPEILQQATGVFKNLKLIKCHAKVCVISTPKLSFTIIGSANFTHNPRKEAGIVTRDYVIATVNKHWIREEFKND